MKRTTLVLALFFISPALGSVTVFGQAPPSLSEVGQKAFALLEKSDYAGAIALLEPAQKTPGLNLVELSMLGTLYIETGRASDAVAVLGPLAKRDDADAAVLFNAGRASMAMGDLPTAEGFFVRSVSQVPVSPAARELGILWGSQGRMFDAYRLLRPWVGRNAGDVEARIAAAACAIRLEREVEAEQLIEGLPNTNPRVAMLRGQVLLHSGKPEDAVAILRPLLESAPLEMRPDLVRLLSDVYVTLGRSQEAIDLVPSGPGRDIRLALILSTAYYRKGDVDEALKMLEPFTSQIPELHQAGEQNLGSVAPKLTFEYGRLLVAAGRSEEAIPFLETSVSLIDDQAPAWKSLGDALLGAGRRDEALVARKKFQQLSARENDKRREDQSQRVIKDPTTRSLIQSQEALKDGDSDKAMQILHREMLISPQDLRLYLSEVAMLLKLGNQQEALERAELTLKRFPGHPDATYQRGVVRLALQQREEAEADLRQTLLIAPQHTAAMNDLAVILMVRGDRDEARQLLEKVLEVRPEDEMARQNLDRLAGAGG